MRNGLSISVSVCVLLMVGVTWSNVQLDQSQEAATGWVGYDSGSLSGQSFTPTMPLLCSLESHHYPTTATTGTYTVEIWSHHSGVTGDPRIALLGSKTLTILVGGWNTWEFDTPIDVSDYLDTVGPQKLMIVWNTSDVGLSMPYSSADPYAGGVRYWITGGDTWTKYWGHDMMFRTYGSLVDLDYCGDGGTVYAAGDVNRDCYVNLRDFALLASNWMHCSDPANNDCDQYWLD